MFVYVLCIVWINSVVTGIMKCVWIWGRVALGMQRELTRVNAPIQCSIETYFHFNNLPSFISLWTTQIPPNYDFIYLTVSIFMISTAIMPFFVVINHFLVLYPFLVLIFTVYLSFCLHLTFITWMLNAYDDLKYFGWDEYLNSNGFAVELCTEQSWSW